MGGPELDVLSGAVVGRHIIRDVDDTAGQRAGQRDDRQCLSHSCDGLDYHDDRDNQSVVN